LVCIEKAGEQLLDEFDCLGITVKYKIEQATKLEYLHHSCTKASSARHRAMSKLKYIRTEYHNSVLEDLFIGGGTFQGQKLPVIHFE
jgi:hypothetical protein